MGRNKKIHDLYDTFVQFRLSRSQYDFLLNYTGRLNMSISNYLRKHIDSLISGSYVDYIIAGLYSYIESDSISDTDKFYLRKSCEVLKKHRKVV